MSNAVCPFCGQIFYSELEDEKALTEFALDRCECDEAYSWRQKQMYIQRATDVLEEIFNYSLMTVDSAKNSDSNFDDILFALKGLIPFVASGNITAFSAQIYSVGKITLQTNADGKIKIKKGIGSSIEKKV